MQEIKVEQSLLGRFFHAIGYFVTSPKYYTPIGLISAPIAITTCILLFLNGLIPKVNLILYMVLLTLLITLVLTLIMSVVRVFIKGSYFIVDDYKITYNDFGTMHAFKKSDLQVIHVVFQRAIFRNVQGEIVYQCRFYAEKEDFIKALQQFDYPFTDEMEFPKDYKEEPMSVRKERQLAEMYDHHNETAD